MRVITGTARGRKLKTPEGMDIRPTTDNVKESIFNIIQFDIEGRRVLDLFAGTGQLGIECLSRGAKEAVFVDSSREAVKIIKDNLKTCGFSAPVMQMDSQSFLRSCGQFDLILIDPPYDSGLYEGVLETCAGRLGANFFLLPSSIHEVFLLPYDRNLDVGKLRAIVLEANRTQVEPEEQLSDSVYFYSQEERMLRLL